MGVLNVFIIAIALAMDAFGVSLSIGIDRKVEDKNNSYLAILSFGFFQFLFSLCGGIVGSYFNNYVCAIPSKLLGAIIALVGILMINDGRKNDEKREFTGVFIIILLGISVSIDALAVGFTSFSIISNLLIILVDSIIIGLVTSFMCYVAFLIAKYVRKINMITKYSSYLGGIILILIAIKTLLI